jgi:hypothetical protein
MALINGEVKHLSADGALHDSILPAIWRSFRYKLFLHVYDGSPKTFGLAWCKEQGHPINCMERKY